MIFLVIKYLFIYLFILILLFILNMLKNKLKNLFYNNIFFIKFLLKIIFVKCLRILFLKIFKRIMYIFFSFFLMIMSYNWFDIILNYIYYIFFFTELFIIICNILPFMFAGFINEINPNHVFNANNAKLVIDDYIPDDFDNKSYISIDKIFKDIEYEVEKEFQISSNDSFFYNYKYDYTTFDVVGYVFTNILCLTIVIGGLLSIYKWYVIFDVFLPGVLESSYIWRNPVNIYIEAGKMKYWFSHISIYHPAILNDSELRESYVFLLEQQEIWINTLKQCVFSKTYDYNRFILECWNNINYILGLEIPFEVQKGLLKILKDGTDDIVNIFWWWKLKC